MFTTLIVFQVLVAVGLIAIVLVQRGPGATMGAAFGAGASGTVFGSRGAGNFLTRTTGWLAVGFFGISLALAVIATGLNAGDEAESALSGSVLEQEQADEQMLEPEAAGEQAGADIDSALEELDRQSDAAAGESDASDEQQNPPATGQDDGSGEETQPEPPAGG
ncbi:MAG: preprotein translocase subunit SecG [Candidatus Wenzhouxiangella sp. M2_3B_020]